MIKGGKKAFRITENRERNSMEIARFSVSYTVPKDAITIKPYTLKIIQKLGRGCDAIMEYNSGFTGTRDKKTTDVISTREYVEEFKRLGIEYKYRKVPIPKGSFLANMFSLGGRREDDEIMAYISSEMFSNEEFVRLLPMHGVRFFFAERRALTGGDEDLDKAISRFMDMIDFERLELLDSAVFCYASFGQIGISTQKIDYMELDEILNNE